MPEEVKVLSEIKNPERGAMTDEFETDMTALMRVLQDETFKIMEKASRNEWTPGQVQNEMKLLLGADNMGLTEYFNLF